MMLQMIRTAFAFLLLLVLSAPPCTEAATIFKSRVPTACVTDYLGPAGFCSLDMGCQERCFADAPAFSSGNAASTLAFESDPLRNFFIPVNATECDQLEEPICPATSCCPSCKEELEDLFRCMINEGGHHYLYYLAGSCPLGCSPPTPPPTRPPPPTLFPTPLPTPAATPLPTPAATPLRTPGATPRSTPGPTQNTTPNPIPASTTNPLPSASGPNVGSGPIVDVGVDSNSTFSNFTAYNFTNCTVQDFRVVCTTYLINGTSAINGTVDDGASVATDPSDNGSLDNGAGVATDPSDNGSLDNGAGDAIDPVDNGTFDNDASEPIDPVDNDTTDSDTGGYGPTGENAPIRGPITIISTNDSVTMIDNHRNTTTVYVDPAATEPQGNQEPIPEPATVTVESTTVVDVVQSDIENDVVVTVSNADTVTIFDSHHNTTTTIITRPP